MYYICITCNYMLYILYVSVYIYACIYIQQLYVYVTVVIVSEILYF